MDYVYDLIDRNELMLRARDAREHSREIVLASREAIARAISMMDRLTQHRRDRADAAAERLSQPQVAGRHPAV